jgi:hypothetical protein
MVKNIPGGWITVLVGGAFFIYVVGQTNVSTTTTTFANDTVGTLSNVFPGGMLGLTAALVAAGAFLNKEMLGRLT